MDSINSELEKEKENNGEQTNAETNLEELNDCELTDLLIHNRTISANFDAELRNFRFSRFQDLIDKYMQIQNGSFFGDASSVERNTTEF